MEATLLPPKNSEFCAAVAANRGLAECLIANVLMIDLLSAELNRAGLQLVGIARTTKPGSYFNKGSTVTISSHYTHS
jgi:hypothetical protein